ncbi:hypothetical protein MMC12_008713, partial [Toensbergia leucococca]|nr:hypothetical protein [Toensbergia leucococca]
MAADEHQVYATKGDIPYKHIELLGHGASGYVDKVHDVVSPNAVYARKIIRMEASYRREAELAVIENEVRIIRRLRHRHVITALATYQCERDFAIIMLPVADTDLKSFLEQADNMPLSVERYSMMFMMQKWPGCLIQAIDYLHEVRVKHKDIKPANLLITRGNICITDFGIAKNLSHELTTASTGTVGPHTPLYCAPEVAFSGARRGRAADIFSLG